METFILDSIYTENTKNYIIVSSKASIKDLINLIEKENKTQNINLTIKNRDEILEEQLYSNKRLGDNESFVYRIYDDSVNSLFIPSFLVPSKFFSHHQHSLLEEISVSKNNKYFTTIDGVLFNKDLTEIIMYPAGKKSNNYVIPSGIKKIDRWTFGGNNYLKSIKIPSSITHADNVIGLLSANIEEVIVDKGNDYFKSINGVLFDKNLTILIFYPSEKIGETYKIPEGITFVKEHAFSNNKHLKKLVVPSSLHAFENVSNTLNNSLEHIEVSENNVMYASEDGVLYDKHLSRLIKYPSSKKNESIMISMTVKSIDHDAFFGGNNLREFCVDSRSKFFSTLDGVLYSKDLTVLINYPSSKKNPVYVIPLKVAKVEEYSFSLTKYLKFIVLDEKNKEDINMWIEGIRTPNYKNFPTVIYINLKNDSYVNFEATDSILFSNDRSVLIRYVGDEKTEYVVIPNRVKIIEKYAFEKATIKKVIFEEESQLEFINEGAFQKVRKLNQINLPSNLKIIGKYAFKESSIKTITFEEESQLEIIEEGAFSKTKINYFFVPEKVRVIGDEAFSDSKLEYVKFARKVQIIEISRFLFKNSNLKLIDIPRSVRIIWEYAFYNTKIESIEIPRYVENIGKYSFSENKELKSIKFDKYALLENIEEGAFSYSCLSKINLPSSVQNIHASAFSLMEYIEEIEIDVSNKYYASIKGVLFTKDFTTLVSYPRNKKNKTYKIPKQVKNIESKAFHGAENLEKIFVHPNNRYYTSIDGVLYAINNGELSKIEIEFFEFFIR